jgi:hypothetical protein
MRSQFTCVCATVLLSTIGVWPAAGAALQWNVLDATASGPPYPSASAVSIGVFGPASFLPAVQLSRLTLAIDEVTCDGSVRPAALTGRGSGVGDLPGPDMALTLVINAAIDTTSSTQLLIKSFTPDGSTELPVRIQDFSWNASSFDVKFNELMGDGSVHKQDLHGVIAGTQPFAFRDASALPGSVLLSFTLGRTGSGQALDQPIVTMSLTGELVPEPATAMLVLGGSTLLWRRFRSARRQ